MAFCCKEKQMLESGMTVIDNKFILNYLPDAPDKCVAVYMLGLVLAESDGTDNSCATIAKKLDISEEDVMAAYLYWEELGLVHITFGSPQQVVYLNIRGSASALKKVKPSKYSKFTREMQRVIEGRMISPNEYNEYYMFLENSVFEPEALIAVAEYCVALKGSDINYGYILKVAQNQMSKGATTLPVVQDNLNSQQKYDEDLKLVFKALGLSRKIDYTDREMFDKWHKDFGFATDVIVSVAKSCKGKGMNKLDGELSDYYKKGALSIAEIDAYLQEKEHLTELAKQLNRTIGVYYQSVEQEIDEYIVNWLRRGFQDETLLAIAKYCFRSGIRTLQGYANIIDKLYKKGVTTLETLEIYLNSIAEANNKIKSLLDKMGLERNVTSADRALLATWTEWNMPWELVMFAAEKAVGTTSPMAYLNRILSTYKQKQITTVEQAQAEQAVAATAVNTSNATQKVVIGKDITRPQYTDEEFDALFTALDDKD